MWKANGNTTILLLILDSLFPKTEIHMRDASSGDKTGLVTFCVETAFYKRLLKERYVGG
jgi:hypothetical protein